MPSPRTGDNVKHPIVNPAVLLSPVEGGYVAYDPTSDQLHRLNPVAALIVELSDGRRSVEAIRALVSPLLPADAGAEVDRWIEEAAGVGLLILDSEQHEPATGREMSASELAGLADRLREEGKIQTAYICQRRAVELAPETTGFLRHLGELAHILGRREDARDAYERYLDLEPNDAEIQHLLVSLRDEAPPPRVPNECIQQLYHRFSSFYETNMCDDLGYAGPEHLAATIEDVIGDRRELSILDLGCGTGLGGCRLKSRAAHLVGIDLSAEMIEQARKRNIYDRLEVAEVTDWLRRTNEPFDLIVACDTLIYFGDLQQVIAPARRLLEPGGVIAFSVERAARPPYQLTDSGRYVHHIEHVEEVAAELGLQSTCREAFLRMEYGEEVTALYFAMTAA